ncbi:class I SAM-dependent methyltransferase [Luteolibacter arcticus]|uniref:Class I SAM-dependent methyltransferase n=1 Tax=Luteolibacter arcticus TaxID=1581411 RepID=A0ABT3GEP5_9BACT|nr:class I SAM-dependent methyltransferase [Luteolibacter arcticus]MCW1922079.1 class I SAM-dependent methyltransferase [Luteolibacter arcticus]
MCLACDTKLSAESLDEFGGRYLDILNHGALAVMISIGYRTGLFAAMRKAGPATSHELAETAGLHERYVREWLGAMTCGGIATCDETSSVFSLLPAASASLTGSDGAENLAYLAQYVAMMGSVEDKIIDCFHRGGGIPYSDFPRFHEVMAQDSAQTVVGALFEHILPLVPGLALSLHNGIDVLDIGCGRGKALLAMAKQFPNSRFTGWDLSAEATRDAANEAHALGLTNVRFEVRDLSDFDKTAPSADFNLITAFDAIHDQARPDHVLAGIRRALRPDGVFLMQDIGASSNVAENRDHLIGTLLYSLSCTHCMTVSLSQGGLGVGAMWGEQMTREFLTNAGFSSVARHTLPHDIQNYYYLVKP